MLRACVHIRTRARATYAPRVLSRIFANLLHHNLSQSFSFSISVHEKSRSLESRIASQLNCARKPDSDFFLSLDPYFQASNEMRNCCCSLCAPGRLRLCAIIVGWEPVHWPLNSSRTITYVSLAFAGFLFCRDALWFFFFFQDWETARIFLTRYWEVVSLRFLDLYWFFC